MRAKTHSQKRGVQRFGEGIVGQVAWVREVKRDIFVIGRKIHIPGDKFNAIARADCRRMAKLLAKVVQRGNNIFSFVAEHQINDWR